MELSAIKYSTPISVMIHPPFPTHPPPNPSRGPPSKPLHFAATDWNQDQKLILAAPWFYIHLFSLHRNIQRGQLLQYFRSCYDEGKWRIAFNEKSYTECVKTTLTLHERVFERKLQVNITRELLKLDSQFISHTGIIGQDVFMLSCCLATVNYVSIE